MIIAQDYVGGVSRIGYKFASGAEFINQPIPADVTGVDRYCAIVPFYPRCLFLGAFSQPLIMTEDLKIRKAGIPRPPAPTVELGTGELGTAEFPLVATCYLAFRHKIGNRIIAESARSEPSADLSLVNAGVRFVDLPTTCVNERVNFLVGYRAEDGTDAREVWERPLGTTSVDDATASLARGELAPADNLQLPPIAARYGVAWNKRMVYAGGDARYPYRFWVSEAKKPESIEFSYDTLDGDVITGLGCHEETLVVFTLRQHYTARGYDLSNIVFQKASGAVGCVSHFTIRTVGGWMVWLDLAGLWGYGDGLRYLMEAIKTEWQEEFPDNGEGVDETLLRAYGTVHRGAEEYELCLPVSDDPSVKTHSRVGQYADFVRGAQNEPFWFRRTLARMETVGLYTSQGLMIRGAEDGYVRQEDSSNDDDDGDDYEKTLKLRPGPMTGGLLGRGRNSGKTLIDAWFYVQSEVKSWLLYLTGGDEEGWRALTPDNSNDGFWKKTVAASFLQINQGGGLYTYCPETVHPFQGVNVVGRMFWVYIVVANALGFKWRGYGGNWKLGGNARRMPLLFEAQASITSPTSASITDTTATLGGNIIDDNGFPLSERGVVYARTTINPTPLIGGTGATKAVAVGTGTGIFTKAVTGLLAGTGYSFKAYAINAGGTAYTNVGTFTTAP